MERTQPMDLAAAERNIEEKTQNLADLITGPTELEIKSKQLAINQKQNSLWNAQNDLADCYVKAPFDGVVADVGFSRGDTVGSSSILATLITTSRIAEISLNEIDVASIEIGQKVIITFDAIEGLSISGKVIEIDAIGKNSSGVVSYGVKIGFDTQDERIKPGMTISTNIITNSKQNILSVPLSAVKTINNIDYIEILVDGNSQQIIVTTGVSDDTMIEISEGLSEGDQVITQTISGTAVSSTNSSNSDTDAMRGMMQLNGGGGGFPR